MSEKLSRRDFLKLAGATFAEVVLSACAPTPLKPTPTTEILPTPTKTPTKTPTRTPTRPPTATPWPTRTEVPSPTPTPTPEPLKLIERVDLKIPGLSVEVYKTKFQEITGEVTPGFRQGYYNWFKEPLSQYFSRNHTIYEQFDHPFDPTSVPSCGSSVYTMGRLRERLAVEYFYYDGIHDRFYLNAVSRNDSFLDEVATDEDIRLLGWKSGRLSLAFQSGEKVLSCDGKILYTIYDNSSQKYGQPPSATVIADIPNSTKIIIRDRQQSYITSQISPDGSKLLLHFEDEKNPKRGLYLIDLKSWRIQFHFDDFMFEKYSDSFLNEDGSRLYLRNEDAIFDTVSGTRKRLDWATFLHSHHAYSSHPNIVPSRDLNYFAGVLPAPGAACLLSRENRNYTSSCQWAIEVLTPRGAFSIVSPGYSLLPKWIENDGTIHTSNHDILKFDGETYKIGQIGSWTQYQIKESGKPFSINVFKTGN